MGVDDVITLDDSPDAIINITDHDEVSFCQTGNMNYTLHQDNNCTGKVSKINSIITSMSEVKSFCSRKFALGFRPNFSHRCCDQKRSK